MCLFVAVASPSLPPSLTLLPPRHPELGREPIGRVTHHLPRRVVGNGRRLQAQLLRYEGGREGGREGRREGQKENKWLV